MSALDGRPGSLKKKEVASVLLSPEGQVQLLKCDKVARHPYQPLLAEPNRFAVVEVPGVGVGPMGNQ